MVVMCQHLTINRNVPTGAGVPRILWGLLCRYVAGLSPCPNMSFRRAAEHADTGNIPAPVVFIKCIFLYACR